MTLNTSDLRWELFYNNKQVAKVAQYENSGIFPLGKNQWSLMFDCYGGLEKAVVRSLKFTRVNDQKHWPGLILRERYFLFGLLIKGMQLENAENVRQF